MPITTDTHTLADKLTAAVARLDPAGQRLGVTVGVTSRCPVTGERISLTVGPEGVSELEPAERWTAEHEGTFAIPVADAFEVGRLVNRARFGAALGR